MVRATLLAIGITGFLSVLVPVILATNRYYGTYTVFGTGDTVINTVQAHSGPEHGKRRWHVECLDGEAMIGIQDYQDDFQKIVNVWCKFMFPYKEYTNGLYPYYPDCFVNNYTYQFYCYSPKFHDASVNSFVVGLWDNDGQFFLFRRVVDDQNPYKCCKTPPNYYVDYQSCYYMPTRDQYGEYYDSSIVILVSCATGYSMTGMAKKISPFSNDYHLEWIQCCRIGFGRIPTFQKPKDSYSYGSYANATSYATRPPAGYESQYSGGGLGSRGVQKAAVAGGYSGGQASQMQPSVSGYSGDSAAPYGSPRSLEEEDQHDVLSTQLHHGVADSM